MEKRFDIFIESIVNNYESKVPFALWNHIIQNPEMQQLEFDQFIRKSVGNSTNFINKNLFDNIINKVNEPVAEFDNFINNKTVDFSSSYSAEIWPAIAAALPKKECRRPVAYWENLVSGIFLILAYSLLTYGLYNQFTNSKNKALPKNSTTIVTQSDDDNSTKNIGTENTITTDEQSQANAKPLNKTSTTENNLTEPRLEDKTTLAKTSDNKNTKIATSTISKKNTIKGFGNSTSTSYNTLTLNKNSKLKSSNKIKTIQPNFNASNNINLAESPMDNGLQSIISPINNTEPNFETNYNLLTERQLFNAKMNKAIYSNISKLNYTKIVGIPCPTINGYSEKPFTNWFGEIYTSALYPIASIPKNPSAKLNNDSSNSKLSSTLSYNAGFNIGTNLGSNMLIRTGAAYTQWNQKFSFTNTVERRFITTIIERKVIINPGDTLIIRDTTLVEQIGKRTIINRNRFKNIDIPLLFSYKLGGNGSTLNITAGAIFNIRSWAKGSIADSLNLPLNISNYNGKPVYKTNLGISLYAGATFLKNLNDRMDIYTEPHIRYQFQNMTNNGVWFKQKMIVPGISFGIRYHFISGGQR